MGPIRKQLAGMRAATVEAAAGSEKLRAALEQALPYARTIEQADAMRACLESARDVTAAADRFLEVIDGELPGALGASLVEP